MCGFSGFVGNGNRDDIMAMTSALTHRGPDGEGFFINQDIPIFLGHRRLAILDIERGQQPMWDAEKTICVVFNGEIYNHQELRLELEHKGHTFRSHHSDTEVLVYGYKEWKDELPLKLNGMFAFAVYDIPNNRVFLARDRFGEKPLYYTTQNNFFGFASELQALTHHSRFEKEINVKSLQKFFGYGFLPAPNALYRDCFKLPGGCHLSYDIKSGKFQLAQYWRFLIEQNKDIESKSEKELIEELRHLLSQSVQRRLISDVPLGVFLSGGIDSSTILGLLGERVSKNKIKSFTIGFTEASFDESAYAEKVATLFGSDHHQKILDMETSRLLIPDILSRLGEPLGDPSILPTYLVSRFAREHVKVALSGDGGDELFAGYDPFQTLKLAQFYQKIMPRKLHKTVRRLVDFIPISFKNMSLDFKIRRGVTGLSYPQNLWNPVWLSALEPDLFRDLFYEPLHPEEIYSEALNLWEASQSSNLFDKTLEFYTNLYLQDNILTKVDRASMMVSLESRAIFLDNDLVEFCRNLPIHFKYRNGERKYLLKKVAATFLPSDILNRRKKGFGVPLAKWLREVPKSPPLHPVLGINISNIARYWDEHRHGLKDHRLFLWAWLSLQYAIHPKSIDKF